MCSARCDAPTVWRFTMTPTIRPFGEADFEPVWEICIRSFAPIHQGFETVLGPQMFALQYRDWRGGYRDYLQAIVSSDSAHRLFVVATGETLIGFIAIKVDADKRVGEIDLNAIHPDYQGRGFGTLMYQFALAKMAEAGAELAFVGTGGDAAHAPARTAYQKAGFDTAIPSVTYFKKL